MTRAPRAHEPPDPQALTAFAMRHARVSRTWGSRQHTDSGSYALVERVIPDHNLIYLMRGSALWIVDGVERPLAEGALTIVPPGVPHRGRSTSRVMTLGSLHLRADLPGGRDLFALLAPPPVRVLPRGCRLDLLFRMAMDEYSMSGDPGGMIPHWATLVLKELLRHDASAGTLGARGSDGVVTAMLEWLEAHLSEPVSLAALASRAGFTAQHLNRRFTRAVGMTPLACLAGMRIERASALLREGRLSVQAVAEAVGCADPAYFSRLFRRSVGLSPSAFQRQAGSDRPSAGAAGPSPMAGTR